MIDKEKHYLAEVSKQKKRIKEIFKNIPKKMKVSQSLQIFKNKLNIEITKKINIFYFSFQILYYYGFLDYVLLLFLQL